MDSDGLPLVGPAVDLTKVAIMIEKPISKRKTLYKVQSV